MNKWQEFLYIIRRLNRRRADRDLDEEIRAHLDHEIETNLEKGLSPDEARLKALQSFGSIALSKERSRSMWGARAIETFIQDLRYGLRVLTKKPALMIVAVLSLALGIGANTIIFSGVYAILLQPLPYKDATRQVVVSQTNKQGVESGTSFPDFDDWKQQNTVFEDMALSRNVNMNLTGGQDVESVGGSYISRNFLGMLGGQPILGRVFSAEEFHPASAKTILLSYGFWNSHLGSDSNVTGQQIKLNDEAFTVIGIMPKTFQFPFRSAFWLPLDSNENAQVLRDRSANIYDIVATLKPGVSLNQATKEMAVLAKRSSQQIVGQQQEQTVVITGLRDTIPGVSKYRTSLIVLQVAVLFVLLIASANVANLLLARTTGRSREFTIRLTLGAGSGRLIRQLLSESLLLGLLGTVLGLLLALWGQNWLRSVIPWRVSGVYDVQINAPVLMFTLFVSLLTSLGFGLFPATMASRQDLSESLKSGNSSTTAGPGKRRLSGMLVSIEVALAVMLLMASGLMIRTFLNITNEDPGFKTDHAVAISFSLPRSKYPNNESISSYFDEAISRIKTIPGVEHVGAVTYMPLVGYNPGVEFTIQGRPAPSQDMIPRAEFQPVSADYFLAIGMTLVRGRQFTLSDMSSAPSSAIINNAMAKEFWPTEDPLGKCIKLQGKNSLNTFLTIIGIVGDAKEYDLQSTPRPEIYLPSYRNTMTLIVRSSPGSTIQFPTIRESLKNMDTDAASNSVAAFNMKTMDQIMADSFEKRRVFALLLGILAITALLLSAMGIYGVISYTVAQRTREIGIRLALGAERKDVLKMIMRDGMTLVMLGIVPGLVGSLVLTRSLKSLLFGVSAVDPTTYLAIVIALCATALLACYAPARRASKVDPMTALRYE